MPARFRPSPAIIVACLALIVALGGTSYAVSQLPANSVGTKQLKDHSVTPRKVAPKTVQLLKGVRAYAYVKAGFPHPTLEPARTKGFASVTRVGTTGVYCLTPNAAIDPRTSAPAVTAVWNNGVLDRATAQLETTLDKCGERQIEVYTYTDGSGDQYPHATVGIDFTVVLP
ncbi:MAG: hypothetical protein QOI98_966 [Solirubrobacteraceae bacterium]|nr:hypothetical protein [Solirubrobacteraceae bacterium]